MKTLVIGANGFLGRHIVAACLARGWKVDCIYHKTVDHIPASCSIFPVGDLDKCDNDYDVVFLLAAVIPYGNFDSPSRDLLKVNVGVVLSTVSKFDCAKIVFASSVSVFGIPTGSVDERSPFNSPSMYGLSKIAGEFIVRQNRDHAIIRFSSLYGRGMNASTFLPDIVKQAKEKSNITLFGDGKRLQDYLHVADAAELALRAATKQGNGIYLGVYGKSVSNLEAARAVQIYFPTCSIEFTGTDNSPSFVYDNTFTRKELDFCPVYPLETGIRELCVDES